MTSHIKINKIKVSLLTLLIMAPIALLMYERIALQNGHVTVREAIKEVTATVESIPLKIFEQPDLETTSIETAEVNAQQQSEEDVEKEDFVEEQQITADNASPSSDSAIPEDEEITASGVQKTLDVEKAGNVEVPASTTEELLVTDTNIEGIAPDILFEGPLFEEDVMLSLLKDEMFFVMCRRENRAWYVFDFNSYSQFTDGRFRFMKVQEDLWAQISERTTILPTIIANKYEKNFRVNNNSGCSPQLRLSNKLNQSLLHKKTELNASHDSSTTFKVVLENGKPVFRIAQKV